MRREDLATLVEPILREEGFELVECSVSRTSRSQTFRVSIDRESGVPIAACAQVSRRIALALDANPVVRGTYQLEVSSAGMDRPIWSADHFRRFGGEEVRLELEGPSPRTRMHGVIGKVEGEGVWIRQEGTEEKFVLFARIARAHLHMDPWKRRGQAPETPEDEPRGEPARKRPNGVEGTKGSGS